MKTGTNNIVYDEAHDDLQQLHSFDANLILLKHKLDSFDANLNSLKHKLDSFRTNLNPTKRKLEFAKTQTSTPHEANLISQKPL